MDRSAKINFLKNLQAGKVDAWDLVIGNENWFITIGGCYVIDGIRYDKNQSNKIDQALKRRSAIAPYGINLPASPCIVAWIDKYTKQY